MTSVPTKTKHDVDNTLTKKDGVIKEQVLIEWKTSKEWAAKWGFMLEFDKYCMEAAEERGISKEQYQRMLQRLKKHKTQWNMQWKAKPLGYTPQTCSGFIGWRSSRPDCAIEIFGPLYVSPKHTLPPEEPVNTICLG